MTHEGVPSAVIKTFISKKLFLCVLLIFGFVANMYVFSNRSFKIEKESPSDPLTSGLTSGLGRSELKECVSNATLHNETWLEKRTKLLSAKLPTKLFLFAYMRGGSSIAGEIFNTDPRATMWYEPGDAFFCSYYGLQHENLPQNDLYFRNMTRRILDEREQQALTNFYTNMLTCQYRRLPPEAMGHYFLEESTAMDEFVACTKPTIAINQCVGHITGVCSPMFVEISRFNRCHSIIQGTRKALRQNQNKYIGDIRHIIKQALHNVTTLTDATVDKFLRHAECIQRMEGNNEKCIDRATKKCKSNHLQVLQVNRMKMEDLRPLIEANPDMYVIYYIRDPRAIALSRVSYSNLVWSRNDRRPVSEARLLCHRMAEDLRQLKILQEQYPGIFLQIKYEDLVTDPIKTAQEMYAFVGKTAPEGWSSYVQKTMFANHTGQGDGFGITVSNATENAIKWMKTYPKNQLKETEALCEEYLKAVDYPILEL